MNTSKAAVAVSAIFGKISSVLGYAFGLIGIIGFSVEISENRETSGFVIAVVFTALGVFLIIKGVQIKRRIRRFKRYVSLISTQQMKSLENIAASTSQSVDFVRNDLQKMINKKFFANASINAVTNEIVIGGMAAQPVWPAPAQNTQYAVQPEFEMYTCSGCGASGTKQKGVPGSCDYCGSISI